MEARSFRFSKVFVIGFGFLGISLIWAIYYAYVPIFLKEHFGFKPSYVGYVTGFNNLITLLLLPYFGSKSDRTRTRMGRRMPFLMIGAPLAALAFVLIPWAAGKTLTVMLGVLVLFNLITAFYRSPVVALMPDVTPSEKRSQANGVINLMGGLGALLAYFGGKYLYDRGASLPFTVGAVISVIASIAVIIYVREPAVPPEENAQAPSNLRENIKDVFAPTERSLLYCLMSMFFYSAGFSAIGTFFTSYAKFHLGFSESTGGLILGFFSLAFLVAAIPAGMIGSRVGRKKSMLFGLSVMTVAMLLGYVVHGFAINAFIFIIAGMAYALVNVNALPMVVDMAPPGRSGGYTGLYYFFGQASTLIAPPAAGLLADVLGYGSLMGFSAATFVIGVLLMFGVNKGEAHAA